MNTNTKMELMTEKIAELLTDWYHKNNVYLTQNQYIGLANQFIKFATFVIKINE